MKDFRIDLGSISKHGDVITEYKNNELQSFTGKQNTRYWQTENPIISYFELPDLYRLPLKIDIVVCINSPALYLMLGKGHLTFGSGMDNRSLDDIIEPDAKKPRSFFNRMEMNRDVQLSITYAMNFMQVLIDGDVRYYSRKEKYMKSAQFREQNEKGFPIALACSRYTKMTLKSLIINQYENNEIYQPSETVNMKPVLSIDKSVKSDLRECISELDSDLQDKILELDDFLLARKKLKIKRKIEGDSRACKVNYVSSHGFSYTVNIYGNVLNHFYWWYMVSNYKYENKYMGRKNDLTAQTFQLLDKENKDVAERLFSHYDECVGCSSGCAVKTRYTFNGDTKDVCHGKIIMNMEPQTFRDLYPMFEAIEQAIAAEI